MNKKTKTVGELIYGINPLIEVLKAKRRKILSIYTTKPTPDAWKKIEPFLPSYPIAMQYVTRDVLHRMAGSSDHQGFIAWVQPFPFRKKPFDPVKHPFLVMLDGIQDPRNLGAIIRSAYCTGASGVIVCQKEAAPVNAVTLKASAGLAEHMEIYCVPSAASAVTLLKKDGYSLYLATFDGQSAQECEFKSPLCLVVGSEGMGISKGIMNAGTHITLAQRSTEISYNASVAAGILLFIIATKNHTI
jgi:23S rRNA (guanosine2251-2'-O)-methyltransferase